jgi:segregation and condensation protein A
MLFDLLGALKDVLENAPRITTHDVELLNVTSEMKQAEILGQLTKTGPIDFVEFVTGQPKLIIVVTFIAMLELIKLNKIAVKQSTQFGTIYIYERKDDNITDH